MTQVQASSISAWATPGIPAAARTRCPNSPASPWPPGPGKGRIPSAWNGQNVGACAKPRDASPGLQHQRLGHAGDPGGGQDQVPQLPAVTVAAWPRHSPAPGPPGGPECLGVRQTLRCMMPRHSPAPRRSGVPVRWGMPGTRCHRVPAVTVAAWHRHSPAPGPPGGQECRGVRQTLRCMMPRRRPAPRRPGGGGAAGGAREVPPDPRRHRGRPAPARPGSQPPGRARMSGRALNLVTQIPASSLSAWPTPGIRAAARTRCRSSPASPWPSGPPRARAAPGILAAARPRGAVHRASHGSPNPDRSGAWANPCPKCLGSAPNQMHRHEGPCPVPCQGRSVGRAEGQGGGGGQDQVP